jgi:membrane protein
MDNGNRGTPPADKKSLLHPRVIWDLLKATYEEYSADNAQTLGAALAFYTTFSLAPLLILLTAALGFVLGQKTVQAEILRRVEELIGAKGALVVSQVVQSAYGKGSGLIATVAGIILILVGATSAFVMLRQALNIMWGVKLEAEGGVRGVVRARLLSFVMVLIIGLILVLSLIASAALAALGGFLGKLVAVPFFLFQLADYVLSFALLTLLFALVFKVLPDVDIVWTDVWIGAVITALLFILGKFLLGLYLGRSTISSAYGAAGSLVVILLWVYYSAQILFLGAEFTQVYANRFGSKVAPHPRPKP